jgi:hypothetical protein
MEEQMPSRPRYAARQPSETDSAGYRVGGHQLGRSWLVLAIFAFAERRGL